MLTAEQVEEAYEYMRWEKEQQPGGGGPPETVRDMEEEPPALD